MHREPPIRHTYTATLYRIRSSSANINYDSTPKMAPHWCSNQPYRYVYIFRSTLLSLKSRAEMDPDTRRDFRSITQEQWGELGYLDQDEATPTRGTITDRSLPIFDQRTSWTLPAGMTDDHFQQFTNTLSPVFQLATKIATSPASLEYFYYVLYSVRGELVVPSSDRDSSTKRFAKTYSIGSGETARRVSSALERLASSLKLAFTHPETWPMEGSKAVTVWDT